MIERIFGNPVQISYFNNLEWLLCPIYFLDKLMMQSSTPFTQIPAHFFLQGFDIVVREIVA